MKQLGLGLLQYSQDFDDRFPWRVGSANSPEAWCDLGMLYPHYCIGFGSFLCPKSRDRRLKAPRIPNDKEPLDPFAADLTISYSYCMDARGSLVTAWTEQAPTTVRLAADKKAGTRIGSPGNPMKLANHGGDGRNVLYHDGHVSFKAGPAALDPDEASSSDEEGDMIGEPGAGNHRRWWSDPPYRGE